MKKQKKGLTHIISLKPTKANILLENKVSIKQVDVEKVILGQTIRILPGEIIPLDGIICSGNTTVNQAILTGESLPINKEINDLVYCGTTNLDGSIDIIVTSLSKNSSLEKMIKLIEDADKKSSR